MTDPRVLDARPRTRGRPRAAWTESAARTDPTSPATRLARRESGWKTSSGSPAILASEISTCGESSNWIACVESRPGTTVTSVVACSLRSEPSVGFDAIVRDQGVLGRGGALMVAERACLETGPQIEVAAVVANRNLADGDLLGRARDRRPDRYCRVSGPQGGMEIAARSAGITQQIFDDPHLEAAREVAHSGVPGFGQRRAPLGALVRISPWAEISLTSSA